jgi:O-glycosyl hydrolase
MRPVKLRARALLSITTAAAALATLSPIVRAASPSAQVTLTDPGATARLATSALTLHTGRSPELLTIKVDARRAYQSIQGFGASLTDASSWNIGTRLEPAAQEDLLKHLFDPRSGVGISMLRQPMGATDFNGGLTSELYTYDDMPPGQTDPTLSHFSIAHDRTYTLPQLRRARQLAAGELTVLATPWSPPGWMRTNDSTIGQGGDLEPQWYRAWANYFVKFLQAYRAAGVPVAYLTPQNEPTNCNLPVMPQLCIDAPTEAKLIAEYLAPALRKAKLSTKILGFDYVWDQADPQSSEHYPQTLLKNPRTAAAMAGTAYHCYGGKPTHMTPVHNLSPSHEVQMTECSGFTSWPQAGQPVIDDALQFKNTMNLFISSTRNWSRSVILWNVALDPLNGPNRGCSTCRPLVTITPTSLTSWTWTPQIEYYAMGQVAKYVRPGAHRVGSSESLGGLNNVAFLNRDGSQVVVVQNDGPGSKRFGIQWGTRWLSYTLNSGAAATFVLPADKR